MTEACHASLRSRLCTLTEADQRELYLRAVLVCAGTADCTLARRRSRTCRKTKPGSSRVLVIWTGCEDGSNVLLVGLVAETGAAQAEDAPLEPW